MAESNRVTLAGGLIELSGRLSEEDQGALRAILESATLVFAPNDDDPEVEGFRMPRLDSMSEMGEMESLRLQMAMDRRSKMFTTLGNVMKKMDDTSSGIIGNLK